MIFSIVLAVVGVYCVFMGIRTFLTGTLTAREEDRLKDFSKKGARLYKQVYAAMNIVAGLVVIGLSIIKFLESQHIIEEMLPVKLGVLGIAVIIAVVLLVVRAKCRKMTDDE